MKFLFCVGAEKAGTTWLHEYFRTHPEYYSIGKELNLIQRDDLVPTFSNHPDYKTNIEIYFEEVKKLNKVTGDFTHYEGSTENIFRIFKDGFAKHGIDLVPVYIMREPVSRTWSSWSMLGGNNNFDMPPPAFFITQNYLQCKYKETIIALDNVFENPIYFFYEDFFKQQDVDQICNSLDIQHYPVLTEVVNRGHYDANIPEEFINKFCLTEKNKQAVDFIKERFKDVPWKSSYFKNI